MNNIDFIDETLKYAISFSEVEGEEIPSPSVELQMAIKGVSIKNFEKDFKSDYTFKELKELENLTEVELVDKVKETIGSSKATLVSVGLVACKRKLYGKYNEQIDFVLTTISNKPNRSDSIWRTSLPTMRG